MSSSTLYSGELRPLARGYTREKHVESEIRSLLSLTRSEFWKRIEGKKTSDEALKRETLIYFLREFRKRGDEYSAGRLMDNLTVQICRNLTWKLSNRYGLRGSHCEEVEETIIEQFYSEWLNVSPETDFWEVRFNVCMTRKIDDTVKKFLRNQGREFTPNEWTDEDGSVTDWLERFEDKEVIDPLKSILNDERLKQAKSFLDRLPPPVRTAFYLYHVADWKIESQFPEERTIAKHLDVTGRTIRNWLTKAEAKLKDWREQETN